mmetsp:Transcript_7836/g.22901  ORF Transcript_7836/g.22901 Transcript_7836/m.22901 type:complete len:239 (+) Transcript_7836:98-814(+)
MAPIRPVCCRLHRDATPPPRNCSTCSRACHVQQDIRTNVAQLDKIRKARALERRAMRVSRSASIPRTLMRIPALIVTRQPSCIDDELLDADDASEDEFARMPSHDEETNSINLNCDASCTSEPSTSTPSPFSSRPMSPEVGPEDHSYHAIYSLSPKQAARDAVSPVPTAMPMEALCLDESAAHWHGVGPDTPTGLHPPLTVFKRIPRALTHMGKLYNAVLVGQMMYGDGAGGSVELRL